MPFQPYTCTWTDSDSPIIITKDMGIAYMSLTGRSDTVSSILADNAIDGLPVPAAIDLGNGQIQNFIGANGGPTERIVITIPRGGAIDVLINRN